MWYPIITQRKCFLWIYTVYICEMDRPVRQTGAREKEQTAEEKEQISTSDLKNKRKLCLWSAYGTAGDGTHWAKQEKLLVLPFDIITGTLTERLPPSGRV